MMGDAGCEVDGDIVRVPRRVFEDALDSDQRPGEGLGVGVGRTGSGNAIVARELDPADALAHEIEERLKSGVVDAVAGIHVTHMVDHHRKWQADHVNVAITSTWRYGKLSWPRVGIRVEAGFGHSSNPKTKKPRQVAGFPKALCGA